MADDTSFEIVNKKPNDAGANEISKKDNMSTLLVSNVPPPSALPTFVTTVGSQVSSSNIFHSSTFRPEIPESKSGDEMVSARKDSNDLDESFGNMGSSLFGWVKDTVGNKGSSLLNKVAEKAKSSVGSVITTLDPQMKDFMSTGSEFEIIVTSEKEVEVSAVREAFQSMFSRLSVRGLDVEDLNLARQIVGFESASKAAVLKIERMQNHQSIRCPVVAIQSFIVEILEEKWYDVDLIVLRGFENDLHLETFSQMIPIPQSIVNVAKYDTPKDYLQIDSGFSVAVSHIMGSNLQVHPSEWQETLTGVSRRQRIFSAARVLAHFVFRLR